MKKTSLLLILLFIFTSLSQAQLISERTEGKVIIGADLFTDISTGKAYENFDLRSINQGVSVYSMFNFNFENSPILASIGLGYTGHNFYMKGAYLDKPYDETTVFENVIYDYERSKINTNYIDIPVEVSVKIKNQFKISAGFKFGILAYGKSKYIGELYNDDVKTGIPQASAANWQSSLSCVPPPTMLIAGIRSPHISSIFSTVHL